MKKLTLALATVLSLSTAAFAQQDQSAGQIIFKGTVTSASCSLAPTQDIELGSISTRTLSAAGKTSPWSTSNIQFFDCNLTAEQGEEPITSIDLTIESGQQLTQQLWSNASGDATNVGLELQVNNQPVPPAGATLNNLAINSNGSISVPVRARMQATGLATPGSFNTTVKFNAIYK